MKKYLIYLFVLFSCSKLIFANETTIIELHTKKSLDQLVLEVDNNLEEENQNISNSIPIFHH